MARDSKRGKTILQAGKGNKSFYKGKKQAKKHDLFVDQMLCF